MSYSSDRISSAFHQVQKDVATLLNPKTYEHLSQNQIIGALTVLLLVVGVSVGIYLGGQEQEIRQQASSVYDKCGPNSQGGCTQNNYAGDPCGFNGGTCQNSNSDPTCLCLAAFPSNTPSPTPTPIDADCIQDGDACTVSGVACCGGVSKCITGICQAQWCDRNGPDTQGCIDANPHDPCINTKTNTPGTCSPTTVDQANAECICVSGAATNTPVPQPTNTSVPNTPGQPTNTPVPVPTNTSVPNTPRPTNTPGGPTNTPRPTNTVTPTYTPGGPTITPTNTPVIAPVCVNVTLNNPAASVPNTPPKIGDIVTMTCSQVAGATRYEFRVKLPNGSYVSVDPSLTTPYVSQQLTISTAGVHVAACRPCATVDSTSCAPWEN